MTDASAIRRAAVELSGYSTNNQTFTFKHAGNYVPHEMSRAE